MQGKIIRLRGLRTALITAMAALALTSGCGDGDDGASDMDKSAIDALLVRHYTTPSCADLTPAGRKAFGHPTEDAACAADIRSQTPKEVTVSDIKVNGDTGRAKADGYDFTLARVAGTWLIAG